MDKGLSVSSNSCSYIVKIYDSSRCKLFYEENDFHYFLNHLHNYGIKYGSLLHAYVLMPEFVQLILSCHSYQNIEKKIVKLTKKYESYFNFNHRRIEQLLEMESRMKKIGIYTSLVPLYRYVESLPVTSEIVHHPADYPWSSYGSNALGENVGLITEHESYLSLGPDENIRWSTYRASFDVM